MYDSLENEYTYLQSLGVTSEDLTTLLVDTKHTTFVVAQSVFSGVTKDEPSTSVTVSLGSRTLKLTLRKNISDSDWWLDEESGNTKEHTLFGLHKFAHYDADYTYIIVSPYAWSDNIEDQLLCLNSASLLIRYA